MSDVRDNRRKNFRALVERLGGPLMAATKLGMNKSQVSQLISEKSQKPMGNKLARRIESTAGLPPGALDTHSSADGRNMLTVPVVSDSDLQSRLFTTTGRPIEDAQRQVVMWDNSNPHQPVGPLIAYYIPNDALTGIGHEGDLAIFDCWPLSKVATQRVRVGSVVLLAHDGMLLMRVIKQSERGGYEFFATSPLFASIHLPDTKAILGVLVEVRWLRPRLV